MTGKIEWLRNCARKILHAPAVRHFALLALTLAGLAPLATCGGGTHTPVTTVTTVSIAPTAVSVGLNQFVNFRATVTFANSSTPTNAPITWEVNTIAGGNATVGTIVPLSTDPQTGVYTAPSVVPTNGTVSITAVVPEDPSNSSDTRTVTSNTATVTIGSGAGLAVAPQGASVPAGVSFPFSAMLNSLPDPNATWAVSSVNGGDFGTIDQHTGVYKAPVFPPPGAVVTITATDPATMAMASTTATIIYSDASFKGPFTFSYTGNDGSGFLAVTGSFVADGAGGIISGVEDIQSFLTGISTQVQIRGNLSNYLVGPDGRTTVTLNSGLPSASTLRFALTNNSHGLLVRFDLNATGGGTIDQQDLNALTNSNLVISGPYVFGLLGTDVAFKPLGMAGKFTANAGVIPATDSILDVNDNGAVTSPSDRTLAGTYSFDPLFPGTGRGTLTLTSSAITQRKFAFYIVDSTHLHLVEIDGNSFLAGDVFSGLAGNAFTDSSLAAANHAFTAGGMSSAGVYASGGIFISDGNGNTTAGGAFDSNNAGTVTTDTTINACTYTVDSTTGRIDLRLNIGAGMCPAGPNPGTLEFAVYPTAQGSAVMLELDSTAVSSGLAFQQQAMPSLAAGGFALNLVGQGLLHNAPASIQQMVEGELTLSGTTVSDGTLDINNFGAVFPNNPVGTSGTTVSSFTAAAANGRGTALLAGSNPQVKYNLAYYLIDNNTALFFDSDKTVIAIGTIARQF